MTQTSSEPRAVVLTDAEHEERPDCLVVVVPPSGRGAWEWDPDWAEDEFWLRSVARLVSRAAGAGPEPVGAVVCGARVEPLLPGNIGSSDALQRAARLLDGHPASHRRHFVVVVSKETGRPLLCRAPGAREEGEDAGECDAALVAARAELCKRAGQAPAAGEAETGPGDD